MNQWEVGMTGDKPVLETLATVFQGPDWTVTQRETEFFLTGAGFERFDDASAVRVKACEAITSLSGAMRVHMGTSTSVGINQIVKLGPNGRRDLTIFPATIVATANLPTVSLSVTRADGSMPVSHPTDPVVEAVRKAAQDPAVQEVLRLRDSPDLMWTDLYRILEAIQGNGSPINASKAQVHRFKRTANSKSASGDLARHGHESTKPPPNPMALHEGRRFIDGIIRTWLASK